jgi:hypothetical protein
VVMADTRCWRRTAAPPLRGYRMVDRVLMKRLPKFEGLRWRSCRVMATEVGGDLLVDAGGERGAEIKSCGPNFGGKNLEKGQSYLATVRPLQIKIQKIGKDRANKTTTSPREILRACVLVFGVIREEHVPLPPIYM